MFTAIGYRAAVVFSLLAGSTAAAQQVVERLPNIIALPAFEVSAGRNLVYGNSELRFSVTTANLGDGPLEFIGGETGRGKQNIYQRVYLSDGSFYDRRVGAYVWHPEHNHIHVENYAEYVLKALNAPGNSKRTGQKTSFCVMDTDRIGTSGSSLPHYTTCEATVQGMSVGWGDTYHSQLAGQEIDLTGLLDGDYTLSVVADPLGRITEMSTADNTSCIKVRLTGIATSPSVTVTDNQGCGSGPPGTNVTVSSITPNSGRVGELVPITITGTGFTSGLSVRFESGSGAKLTVTDVAVTSSSEITADVTIQKQGNPRNADTLWDLRVGDAALPNAFTVLP
jgi:lysyl oxidase